MAGLATAATLQLVLAAWAVFTLLAVAVVVRCSSAMGEDQSVNVASAIANVDQARALLQASHAGEALKLLQRGAALYPAHSETHFMLGAAQQASGEVHAALRSYETSLALDPAQFSAHYNTGLIHRHAGAPRQARTAFEQALALRPSCPLTLNNIGLTYHFEGDASAAVRWFQQALAAATVNTTTVNNATVAEVQFNLGVGLSRLGQVLNAAQAYRAAVEAAGENSGSDDIWVSAAMNLAALCTCKLSPRTGCLHCAPKQAPRTHARPARAKARARAHTHTHTHATAQFALFFPGRRQAIHKFVPKAGGLSIALRVSSRVPSHPPTSRPHPPPSSLLRPAHE